MRKDRAAVFAALAVFLLCAAMTAVYLIAGYGAYLDADMASELALAQHLAQEGTLISSQWRYSTEVRVLSTQLIFTPLMALFGHDWQMVRTLGCLILLALMAASCYGCARALGAHRPYALLFSGLTISAMSVVYSQMILIGAYYVPHAILTNACVGLCAAWMQREGRKNTAIACALLQLCAVMGASSIRYLFCATLPVAMAGVWAYVFPAGDERLARTRGQARSAAIPLAACAVSAVGYVAGQRIIASMFLSGSGRYDGSRLAALSGVDLFELLQQAISGLLKLMGYSESSLLLSGHGLVSVGSVGLLLLSGVLLWRGLRDARAQGAQSVRFGALTLVMSAGLALFTFVFVDGLYLNRYWIPVMTLGAPVMAAVLSAQENPVLRRLAAAIFTALVLLSSAAQIKDSMNNREIGDARWAAARQVEETGMTFGYATFWNANILTELTDGRVEVVSASIAQNGAGDGFLRLGDWLEVEANTQENRPEEPVFLLLSSGERAQLDALVALCGAGEQTLADGLVLVSVESQSALFEALRALSGAQ